jgi:hypothetical protein
VPFLHADVKAKRQDRAYIVPDMPAPAIRRTRPRKVAQMIARTALLIFLGLMAACTSVDRTTTGSIGNDWSSCRDAASVRAHPELCSSLVR